MSFTLCAEDEDEYFNYLRAEDPMKRQLKKKIYREIGFVCHKVNGVSIVKIAKTRLLVSVISKSLECGNRVKLEFSVFSAKSVYGESAKTYRVDPSEGWLFVVPSCVSLELIFENAEIDSKYFPNGSSKKKVDQVARKDATYERINGDLITVLEREEKKGVIYIKYRKHKTGSTLRMQEKSLFKAYRRIDSSAAI